MKINTEAHPERHSETLCTRDGQKTVALCRCWKSKNFPYCDGSHRAHNTEHNDHVGPVVVKLIDETAQD